MPRSSTITVTLPDGIMDAMQRRAASAGWGVGAEIKETIKEYLKKPANDDAEDSLHREDLQRSHVTVQARRDWRKDIETEAEMPYPTSTIVVSFPRGLMQVLETRKYARRGGTLAGEVRIVLRAVLKWKDVDP